MKSTIYSGLTILFILLGIGLTSPLYGGIMEKRSLHFSILFSEEYEKYAHITLQFAEEEYLRLSDYTLDQLHRPVTIGIYNPHFQDELMLPELDGRDAITLQLNPDYSMLRKDIGEKLAGVLLAQSVYYSSQGSEAVFPELVHRNDPLVRGYQSYMGRGFDEADQCSLKSVINTEKRFRLSPFANKESLLRYRGFFYYLESEYGRRSCARFISLIIHGKGRGYASKEIFSRSFSGLVKETRRWYDRQYSSSRHIPQKKFQLYKEGNVSLLLEDSTLLLAIGEKVDTYEITRGNTRGPLLERSVYVSDDDSLCLFAGHDGEGSYVERISLTTGRSRGRLYFPFTMITTPSLSPDSKSIVFAGYTAQSCDLYEYSFSEGDLVRITEDFFVEQDPVYSPDGRYILCSSNYTPANDFDSSHRIIREIDRITRQERIMAPPGRYNIQPVYSADGKYIWHIFLADAATRICRVDRLSGEIQGTQSSEGGLFPFVSNSGVVFNSYNSSSDSFRTRPESEIRVQHLLVEDISRHYPERSGLVDYSDVEVSTYKRDGWSVSTEVKGRLFLGENGGAQIRSRVYDAERKHDVTIGVDHMYGNRDPQDLGFSLSYDRRWASLTGSLSFSRLYPSSLEEPSVLVRGTGSYPVQTLSLGGAYVLDTILNMGGGVFYTTHQSEGENGDVAYISPFISVNLGRRDPGLFSDGNYISLKGFLADGNPVITGQLGLYCYLFPRFLYSLEGNITHIEQSGQVDFYAPLGGERLRGFPKGYGMGSSVFQSSHQFYYIPFYDIALGSIHTGPFGMGFFYDSAYVREIEESAIRGYADDLGVSIRMGLPDKYYLKLDCVIPLFYGYNDDISFIFTTGITF